LRVPPVLPLARMRVPPPALRYSASTAVSLVLVPGDGRQSPGGDTRIQAALVGAEQGDEGGEGGRHVPGSRGGTMRGEPRAHRPCCGCGVDTCRARTRGWKMRMYLPSMYAPILIRPGRVCQSGTYAELCRFHRGAMCERGLIPWKGVVRWGKFTFELWANQPGEWLQLAENQRARLGPISPFLA
jgi:hypothetical protein